VSQGCALHLLQATATATAKATKKRAFRGMAGWVRLRGRRKYVHGARSRIHALTPCNRTHPAFDSFRDLSETLGQIRFPQENGSDPEFDI
jgi:hypothetical protein